jgi:transcriptional regulator with XRE-family HTH domain
MGKTSTALWRWMVERRVTLAELAAEVGANAVYIGQLRRGVANPSDSMKRRIATATLELERKRGYANPVGVPATTWLEEPLREVAS